MIFPYYSKWTSCDTTQWKVISANKHGPLANIAVENYRCYFELQAHAPLLSVPPPNI